MCHPLDRPGSRFLTWAPGLACWPAGTPKEVVTRLNTEMVKIISRPTAEDGRHWCRPYWRYTPEQMARQIEDDTERFARLVKRGQVVLDKAGPARRCPSQCSPHDHADPGRQNPTAFLRHLATWRCKAPALQGLQAHLPVPPKGRTLVLGATTPGLHGAGAGGRCGLPMRRSGGLVVTRYGHIPPGRQGWRSASKRSRPPTRA